jgi:hypothetical protein
MLGLKVVVVVRLTSLTLNRVMSTMKTPTMKTTTPGAASLRFVEKPGNDAVRLV